ncbi:MAG: deoxyribodipyrimidine photo-lyase [Rhodothermaceae bacterium]
MNRALEYGEFNTSGEFVVYLITREYRAENNWSLTEAADIAKKHKKKLIVTCLVDKEKDLLNEIQFPFLADGIKELKWELKKKNIPLYVLEKLTLKKLNEIIKLSSVFHLVTDLFAIKKVYEFIREAKNKLSLSVVDSHNIVPCFIASPKQEYGAYTIRPKIKKKLPEYLIEFPKIPKFSEDNFLEIPDYFDNSITSSDAHFTGGRREALKMFEYFIGNKLENYDELRNDPTLEHISNLSPYLHFGFISAQEIALKIRETNCKEESKEAFLEELIIRKELADNFCFYNKDYDSFSGIHPWAQETLNNHRNDQREFIYKYEEFEKAKAHDPLWNAAQNQLLSEGKIHGYMRMYWAKKILEWSSSPEDAFETAIRLNDGFALDGIDPNGYTGIAWSIGGVHDRAWQEREVYGKIRYMNYNGCKRKFDVEKYIKRYSK